MSDRTSSDDDVIRRQQEKAIGHPLDHDDEKRGPDSPQPSSDDERRDRDGRKRS